MTRGERPRVGLLVIALLGLGANLALAEPGTTREPPTGPASLLEGFSPLSITAGTTSEWTVTGRNLGGVERVLISGEGVTIIDRKLKPSNAFALTVRAEVGAEPGLREVRAESPNGLSNFLLFRVEMIPIVREHEPNDDPAHAREIAFGSAVAGTLEPRDLDHFRCSGRAGQRVMVEVEAHRLGSPALPVVTLLTSSGNALAQGRETRGDRDGRLSYRLPREGTYPLLVHDFLFGGDDGAGYRLRVSDAPFATGLVPLGGRRGRPITITASGGSLAEPRTKAVALPDEPGAVVEPAPFDGLGGPVSVPQRLARISHRIVSD
jgi:hypothetical protein